MVRDTNADWEGISGEPYYGIFGNPEDFRDRITPERLEYFWETGRNEIHGLLGELRHHYGDFNPKSAIDFGCGVGRLAKAMAGIVDTVYGVEVASGMREEARRHGLANFEIVSTVEELPDTQVDWINSTLVFQHIPPANGFPILQRLLDKLAPGGAVSLHFGLFKERDSIHFATGQMDFVYWDGERMKGLIETPFASGTIIFYDYDFNQIFAMLCQAGITRFAARHCNFGGEHGAFLIGRKSE
jgi:SAM-dependent methyltransferase